MKKKLKSILSAALAAVMLLSLAACGSGSGGLNKPASEKNPVYLSDMLEAGGTRIWYEVDNTGAYNVSTVGKDSKITKVLVFENGEVTVYVPDTSKESEFRTLGDAAKLTDAEIIELLKQIDYQKDQANLEDISSTLDRTSDPVQAHEDFVMEIFAQFGEDTQGAIEAVFLDFLFECMEAAVYISGDEFLLEQVGLAYEGNYFNLSLEDILDLTRKSATIIYANRDSTKADALKSEALAYCSSGSGREDRSAYPYTLNVITDRTGNNTASEKIIFTYEQYVTPAKISTNGYIAEEISSFAVAEELYTSKEGAIELNHLYGESLVYDSLYGGFVFDGSSMFITEIGETLISGEGTEEVTPKLDNPGAKGVIVD